MFSVSAVSKKRIGASLHGAAILHRTFHADAALLETVSAGFTANAWTRSSQGHSIPTRRVFRSYLPSPTSSGACCCRRRVFQMFAHRRFTTRARGVMGQRLAVHARAAVHGPGAAQGFALQCRLGRTGGVQAIQIIDAPSGVVLAEY